MHHLVRWYWFRISRSKHFSYRLAFRSDGHRLERSWAVMHCLYDMSLSSIALGSGLGDACRHCKTTLAHSESKWKTISALSALFCFRVLLLFCFPFSGRNKARQLLRKLHSVEKRPFGSVQRYAHLQQKCNEKSLASAISTGAQVTVTVHPLTGEKIYGTQHGVKGSWNGFFCCFFSMWGEIVTRARKRYLKKQKNGEMGDFLWGLEHCLYHCQRTRCMCPWAWVWRIRWKSSKHTTPMNNFNRLNALASLGRNSFLYRSWRRSTESGTGIRMWTLQHQVIRARKKNRER